MKTVFTLVFSLLIAVNGLFSQYGQPVQIDFTPIDSSQYMALKKAYINPLITDTIHKTVPDSFFTLTIKNTPQKFECTPDFNGCYYYKGFFPALKFYAVTYCDMHTCNTYLIHQETGDKHALFSPFDNESEAPILSPNKTKVLVYASNVFDVESYISIYAQNQKTGFFEFKKFKGLALKEFRINDAIWVNESTIALITSNTYGASSDEKTAAPSYLLGKIK